MERNNDLNNIPEHLIQTVETLLNCLSLSQQNEMSFPPSLFAHERSFVHKRAKELKYYSVTKRGFGLSNRSVSVYKTAPHEAITLKYPIVLLHDTLIRIFSAMEKNPMTSLELRNFVLIKDHDDMNNQDNDLSLKNNRDYSDLEYNFPLPGQAFKAAKFNSSVTDHRKSLPIYNYKQTILSYLTENRIVLIHGGVASGKSTQVPQYLMEKCIEAKVGYKIILCEPHRITAVAVAERIAFERREEIGQSVGYQIPLETKKSATSIVICVTADVLLKMLISKEQVFQGKVIVVIDEFEESDYITEFVLIALKDLFKVNQYLRLIIMTNATNVSALYAYFQYPKAKYDISIKTACINVLSNVIPIQEFFLEDILLRTDYLARSKVTNLEISPACGSTFTENLGINSIEKNALEVINSTMEKVWSSGEDDGFTFLINMMKKSVISVNYKHFLNGVTLLMSASNCGKINYVSELLKLGADATIRCHSGYTASDLAMCKNHQEIMQMLHYYLVCNNEKVFLDREFIKLTACTRSNEHTERLIKYYDYFYPENGIDLELLFTVLLHVHAFSKPDSTMRDFSISPALGMFIIQCNSQHISYLNNTFGECTTCFWHPQCNNNTASSINFIFLYHNEGAVMIFLPSFSDILAFRELLFERESQLVCKGGSFILRYLYTNMQTSEQKLIFQTPPPDSRKIILSTDVGAVGITIGDLVYVIDTGKIEQKMYVDHTGRLTFVTGWISGSHALQRSTKIGRLQPGCCYRLYPQLMTLPEKTPCANLFTCSPQMLCLYTKQIIPYTDPVMSYLQRAFTVPDFQSMKQSVDFLKCIDAFDICKSYEYLTELGKIMLQLPLEPQYAKMVLYAVALKCLDPILTIAAFSKHKSIFTLEQDYKAKSHVAGKEWRKIASKFYSDHLILIKMFLGRQDAGVDKREKKFCEEYCISQATMELVNTTRSNIVGHLRAMGIVKTRGVNDMRDLNSNSKEWVFVKAALVGGLYPNLVSVDRTTNKLFCSKNKNEVLLNPLSVLLDYSLMPSNQFTILSQSDVVQHLPTDWIVCNELSNMYSDNIFTASVCTSVTPVTLALFAGSYKICSTLQNQRTALLVQNTTTNFAESDSEDDDSSETMKNFMIDLNLQFNMNDDTAKSILYLRVKWFSYFFKCLKYPSKPTTPEDKCVLDTIAYVLKNEEKYKFPAGDPAFIGHKPAAYTIDLFQQPVRCSKSVSDVVGSVGNPCRSPTFPGLITENSRYFLIRSYNGNNISASLLRGRWRFEQSTEMKLLEVFRTGAEIKLIFQFTGTNCFQGMALLLSDRYCTEVGFDSRLVGGFLPIQWLKEGLVPMSAVEEYMDAATCNKLKASADGSELDCSLASTLIMMWNTSQMLLRTTPIM